MAGIYDALWTQEQYEEAIPAIDWLRAHAHFESSISEESISVAALVMKDFILEAGDPELLDPLTAKILLRLFVLQTFIIQQSHDQLAIQNAH